MPQEIIAIRIVRNLATPACLAATLAALTATRAQAQTVTLLGVTRSDVEVCAGTGGLLLVVDSEDSCASGSALEFPTGISTGNATLSSNTTFSGGTVSFSGVTTAFGGGSVSFNNPVTFTGSSATFSTPTTFQNPTTFNGTASFTAGITTVNITNSGGIMTGTLAATSGLTVSAGASVNMGGNIIHGVAAGIASTDAVNVAQLNAATSGITADLTALETTTATHTTQIATLESSSTAQAMQISDIQTVNTMQATQITALQAADVALDTRVDTLELLGADLDERIGKVDDRASAGTAAAVALSGAMFLPGKTFNLTGNVGSYRGAHAAALQLGALVSDNVALNAGVAHGFNKGGKTAFRAGFTVGW